MPSLTQLRHFGVTRAYDRAAGPAIENMRQAGAVFGLLRAIDDLKTDAQSVESLDEDHQAVVALLAALTALLVSNRQRIEQLAPHIQRMGVQAGFAMPPLLAFPGRNRAQIEAAGVWASPGLERTEELVTFIDRPAWRDKLDSYEAGVAAILLNTIRRGGRPAAVADTLARQAEMLPPFYADSLLRTLQFAAFRDASHIQYLANADIIEYILRVAVLDERTCPACIALHGTKWPRDHIVDDHHRGRCIGVPSISGNRRSVTQTGEEWLSEQPEATQRKILGGAKFNALNAGAIELGDVVGPYSDDLFGTMVRERSLVDILGDDAEQFYQRNQ